MITRRRVLATVPASLVAGSNFFSFALADDEGAAIRPDPGAAKRILSALDGYSKTTHYEATRPLIIFYSRLAELRASAASAKNRLNTKEELRDSLKKLNDIYGPVNTALSIRKKTDDIIEGDNRRRISPQEKTRLSSEIDIKNSKLGDILSDLLHGPGYFDINSVRQSKSTVGLVEKLVNFSDELLKSSIELSNWGPDAFYAVARGYATFQFVRDRVRFSRSSPLLARAYTLKIMGDSESYFSLRAASLTAPPATTPAPTTAPAVTGATGQINWTARYEVEKDMIDKRFPKQVYLGSQLGREARCDTPGRRIRNFYGTFTNDSSFERGFRLGSSDGVSISDCTSALNDRSAPGLNDLLSALTKFPPVTTGNADRFKQTMSQVEKSLNEHINFLKARKKREEQQAGNASPPPPTTPPSSDDEVTREFKVMQQMTSALREVLAVT